jgi:hypothetical protein
MAFEVYHLLFVFASFVAMSGGDYVVGIAFLMLCYIQRVYYDVVVVSVSLAADCIPYPNTQKLVNLSTVSNLQHFLCTERLIETK